MTFGAQAQDGTPLRRGQFVWTEYGGPGFRRGGRGPGRQIGQVVAVPHTRVGFKVYARRWSATSRTWTRTAVDVTGRVIGVAAPGDVPEEAQATAPVRP